MGPPAGGLVLMPITGLLIESFGWRGTLQVFSVLAATVIPVVLVVVRNTPSELDQQIDGEPVADDDREPSDDREWTPAEILKNRNFWALAFAIGMVFGLGGGWQANLPRFGEDLGHTVQRMSVLMGIGAGLGVPGTLLFGWLADRYDNRRLLWMCIGGQLLAFVALATEPAGALFVTALLLPGFTGGGLLPVNASLLGRLFGAKSFGTAMGLGGLVMLPFGAGAPVIAGLIRDGTGSYVGALQIFAAAFTLSCILLLLIRMPRDEATA
jgi:sugar phosphate permease